MEFGSLIGDAWRLTWQHRFLWVLGLFAAGTGGSCSINVPGSGSGGTGATFDETGAATGGADLGALATLDALTAFENADDVAIEWLLQNFLLIATLILLVLVLVVAAFVISVIAEGGMARATTDLARGRPVSLRLAWRTGLDLFWRYLGLRLVLFLVGLAVVVIGAGSALAAFFGVLTADQMTPLAALLLALAVLAGIVTGIVLSIVGAYAQRSIVVRDVGAIAALVDGWGLFRRNLGTGLLLWLIGVALTIGAGLALAIVFLVVGLPLFILGVIIYRVIGAVIAFLYIVVASLIAAGVLWLGSAIINTFQWSYWTFAYLRLTGQAAEHEEGTVGE